MWCFITIILFFIDVLKKGSTPSSVSKSAYYQTKKEQEENVLIF